MEWFIDSKVQKWMDWFTYCARSTLLMYSLSTGIWCFVALNHTLVYTPYFIEFTFFYDYVCSLNVTFTRKWDVILGISSCLEPHSNPAGSVLLFNLILKDCLIYRFVIICLSLQSICNFFSGFINFLQSTLPNWQSKYTNPFQVQCFFTYFSRYNYCLSCAFASSKSLLTWSWMFRTSTLASSLFCTKSKVIFEACDSKLIVL